MAGKRARIKDHIARGDMTEEEAQIWGKKGFNRNMYVTIPEKPTLPLVALELADDEKKTGKKR